MQFCFGLVRSICIVATMLSAMSSINAARAQTDWTTAGFDQQRTGYNPAETKLSQANAGLLALKWSTDIWGTGLTQPTLANNVSTAQGVKNLVFVATLYGDVFGLDAANGNHVWQTTVPQIQTNCGDFSATGGFTAVIGTPTLDRAHSQMFLVAGDGRLHALSLSNGQEMAGFPVQVLTGADLPPHSLVYGSPTFDAKNGLLYIATAGACDVPPYYGQIIQVNLGTRSVAHRWYTMRKNGTTTPSGGGIWGPGGVSLSTDTTAIFALTGNALTNPQNYPYAESVLRLSRTLALVAANAPSFTNGTDQDFGATPMLYAPSGCPAELVGMNKSGALLTYDQGGIANGPRQRIQITGTNLADYGNFIGSPAYDPTRRRMFFGNPSDSADVYHHGLIAMNVRTDCSLALAWQSPVGLNGPNFNNPMIPPTVANGVVYYADGDASQLFAYNADTGQQLWNSGSMLTGGIFTSPTVANGQLYSVSYGGHTVYAFSPGGK